MSKEILVIEDDRYIHSSLRQLLEEEGYRVLSAMNGQEGLQLLRNGSHPDLILLDLMMPIMDGFQFRQEQMADPSLAKLPVVVMSAYGQAKANSEKLAVEAYLRKPIDIDILLETVKKWCG